jgi:hypothetical protein
MAEMHYDEDDNSNFIECAKCHASSAKIFSEKEDGRPHLIELWNTRAEVEKPYIVAARRRLWTLEKALRQRVEQTGDTSPGNWNFAADIVIICAMYASGWTNRTDDAMRIPDMLDEVGLALRECAKCVIESMPPEISGALSIGETQTGLKALCKAWKAVKEKEDKK